MKPTAVEQDEMFPEGINPPGWDVEESSVTGLPDIGSEQTVHSDFYNDFGDLCDDEDLS